MSWTNVVGGLARGLAQLTPRSGCKKCEIHSIQEMAAGSVTPATPFAT